jgi:hypothetical protein
VVGVEVADQDGIDRFAVDASRGEVAKKQPGRRTEDRSDVAVAATDLFRSSHQKSQRCRISTRAQIKIPLKADCTTSCVIFFIRESPIRCRQRKSLSKTRLEKSRPLSKKHEYRVQNSDTMIDDVVVRRMLHRIRIQR